MLNTAFKSVKSLFILPKNNFQTIKKYIPAKWEPYYRLGRYDKQIGTQLVYIPCLWGLALGQPFLMPFEFIKYAGLMWVGAVVARSAGCIVNDLWDIEFDKQVERTKTRPLASGELTKSQAMAFFVPHVLVGLGVLSQMNWLSFKWIWGIVPVAALYPAAKRFTHYPQVVLGSAFNWGVWCGYAAMSGMIDYYSCGLSYIAGICWTLIYDTIYAHQDIQDDLKVGLKSTAIAWGDKTKQVCEALNVLMTCLFMGSGFVAGLGWPYYPAILASGIYQAKIISEVNLEDRDSCWKCFTKNRYYGMLIAAAMLIGKETS